MKTLYSYTVNDHPVDRIEWQETALPVFDELIISWNATRPKQGSYLISFRIQTKENEWLPFMPYASWGSSGQKSYSTTSNNIEIEQDTISIAGDKAIGFCVRIEAECGADLADVHTLCSSITNRALHCMQPLVLPEIPTRVMLEPLSQMTLNHPRKKHLCSPTATCAVINYLSNKKLSPLEVAENVWDSSADVYGNWVFAAACASHHLGHKWTAAACRLNSFDEIAKPWLQTATDKK